MHVIAANLLHKLNRSDVDDSRRLRKHAALGTHGLTKVAKRRMNVILGYEVTIACHGALNGVETCISELDVRSQNL
ncbi:hypothetical protein IAQ61_007040 [Plenodomus lingam]|uniref:uncharacterized protein n=1 Tax=Leptosphaeria maculans TaxID=5022 RepID=UPI00332F09C3|nr:hypothetical protein IAQ61_007040 [Plenodomus lingam]